jgi:hypothetical protein
MNTVRSDFRQRSFEVRRYFRFVIQASTEAVEILIYKDTGHSLPNSEKEELLKTLKASCYLLLYNLIESTMRNIIEAIFDEFRVQGIRFDDCRNEVKRLVLVNFRARNTDTLMSRMLDIARHVVTETFESKETFAGNIDARMIRDTAKRFGFAEPTTKTGWIMRTVKDNRNDLAHGNKSFSEIGKDTTPDRLEEARKQTAVILILTIRSVSAYLIGRRYLAANVLSTS